MLKRILFIIGSLLILMFILFSLFPSAFAPYELKEMDEPWLKCSKTHLLGTNKLGYDILTEIIYGTRETLTIGVTASILALALGLIFGGISCENNLFGRLSTALINIMAMVPRLITLIVLSTFFYSSQSVMILLIAICTVTIGILVVALKLNQNREENLLSESKIKNYLTEIKYDEISNHVIEQPSSVIYVSNSSEDSTKKFENIFIPVVKKYNLENEIIYININGITVVDPFYQSAPELVFYTNGEVSDVIDVSTLKTKDDIIKVLKERSVIND